MDTIAGPVRSALVTVNSQKARRSSAAGPAASAAEAPAPPAEPSQREALSHVLGAISALLPIGMFATGPDGRCWYYNQRLVDSLGFEPISGSVLLTSSEPTPPGDHSQSRAKAARPPGPARVGAGLSATLRLAEGEAGDAAGGEAGDAAGGAEIELPAWVVAQVRRDGRFGGYVGVVVDDGYPDDSLAAITTPRLLHTSERLVDTLLDSTSDVVTVLNADGSWRYSNAAGTRLVGFLEDFDANTGVLDLLHPDDVATAADALARIQAGLLAPDETIETRVRAFDGSWRHLETTAEDLTDDPVVHGIVLTSRDVTERHEARTRMLEANQRLNTVMGSLHIAALVEDENRCIVLTNAAFIDLFEIERAPQDLVGRTLEELGPELSRRFGDPTRDPGRERLAQILARKQRVVGDRLALSDGRVLERDFVPIHVHHEYRGHLWLFRDVSSQATAEAEWEQLLATQRDENLGCRARERQVRLPSRDLP